MHPCYLPNVFAISFRSKEKRFFYAPQLLRRQSFIVCGLPSLLSVGSEKSLQVGNGSGPVTTLTASWVPALSPQQVLDRMGLAPGASLQHSYKAPINHGLHYGGRAWEAATMKALTSHLSRQVNHTGSDVSIALGVPFSGKTGNHVSLRADWWQWKSCLQPSGAFRPTLTPWK